MVIFCCMTNTALARPVSYPGGWTLMQQHGWQTSRLHLHYSPSSQHSLGIAVERYDTSDRYDINLQWNHLLARKNQKGSQANLYLKTQAGMAFEGDETAPNLALGIAGDWETRRYFASYEATGNYADEIDDGRFYHKARLGIAPYVAGYGKLHSWIMLQAEHHPEAEEEDEQLLFTPMIRIFKGDYLGELGINNNGDAMVNWIVRF